MSGQRYALTRWVDQGQSGWRFGGGPLRVVPVLSEQAAGGYQTGRRVQLGPTVNRNGFVSAAWIEPPFGQPLPMPDARVATALTTYHRERGAR